MRKWEEIVKDKLEGYESPLPEGHLADFRARRMKAGEASRRFPWGLVATAAVAASLASGIAPVSRAISVSIGLRRQ